MRPNRFLLPLAAVLVLAPAAPAAALDWSVEAAADFSFKPAERRINLGDSVTWSFTAEGHTSASVGGQADSWKSIEDGVNPVGSTFQHVFTKPGRFQYVCLQHKDFMKGVIEVGTDTVIDSIDNFKTKRTGNRVRISFLLKEPAVVRYSLRGPSRRTVKRGRLEAGTDRFTLRRLKRGTYRGVLTVVDDFDKKITRRNFFVIR
jgi:plastocyanin